MASLTDQGKALRIVGIVIATILLIVTLIVNFFSAQIGQDLGWYLNSTGGVSDRYSTQITPAGFAFSIWGIIYLFQSGMMVYIIFNVFRKNEKGNRVIFDPDVFTTRFIFVYGFNFVFNSSWIFLFDRSIANVYLLSVACAVLWCIFGFLAIAMTIQYIDFRREVKKLEDYNMKIDIWVIRVLAHNGISMYATWCAVASPLNTAIALQYVHHMSSENASTVALVILAVEILVYVGLDTFVLDRWTRYTVTPHLVLVWALTASVIKNYSPGKRNSIFTVVLLALAAFAVLEKIVLIIYRNLKNADSEGKYDLHSNESASIRGTDEKQNSQ